MREADPAAAPAPEPDVFYLLPEHLPAFALWLDIQTQWRVGMGGAAGLDYAGVRAAPAFRALPRSKRESAFAGVCIMERATLDEWARRRQANNNAKG